jgi:hypothetical protein
MIKVAAALLLVLGSGLIFKALVAMDAPTLRLRSIPRRRRPITEPAVDEDLAVTLRRAA